MSESKKEKLLLGKKRESEKLNNSEEEKESPIKKQKKSEVKKDDNLEKKDVDDSSESSDSQPKQTLFGNNEKGFTGGLFGDLDNPQKSTSLFEKKDEGTGLFSNTGGSLFGNIKTEGGLFGSTKTEGSLFGNSKSESKPNEGGGLFSGGLFDFSQINKPKDNDDNEINKDEGEEGDDNIGKSNSPKREYNPEENKEDKDGFIKRYSKKVDNTLLYDKLQKTYISRGEGFIIIETQEKDNNDKKERFARIIYRNTIGGIIFQGILHKDINKCIIYEKKLKHICHFIFLIKEEDEKNPLSLGQAKIPFTTIEEINKFSEAYNNTIKYIKNDIDDF